MILFNQLAMPDTITSISLGPVLAGNHPSSLLLLTLNRRLGTHRRDGAKATDNKVLICQILGGASLGGIVAKVGHLGGGALALERRLVRRARRVGADGSAAEASDRGGGSSGGCGCC